MTVLSIRAALYDEKSGARGLAVRAMQPLSPLIAREIGFIGGPNYEPTGLQEFSTDHSRMTAWLTSAVQGSGIPRKQARDVVGIFPNLGLGVFQTRVYLLVAYLVFVRT
jgi:hypothetical protein